MKTGDFSTNTLQAIVPLKVQRPAITRLQQRQRTPPPYQARHLPQKPPRNLLWLLSDALSPAKPLRSPTVLADKAHDKVKSFCKKMLKQKGSINGFYPFYPMSHDYKKYAKTYISAKFVNMMNSNNGSRRCVVRRPREQWFFPGSTSALRTFPWSEWQRRHLEYQQANHRASEEAWIKYISNYLIDILGGILAKQVPAIGGNLDHRRWKILGCTIPRVILPFSVF